jgi:hypothetical protein
MSTYVTSTLATVRNPQQVREILGSYKVSGVEIKLYERAGSWILEMGKDPDPDGKPCPVALHVDDRPAEGQYPDEWSDEVKWDCWLGAKGDEGFQALLRDLIPCLETPLLILTLEHHQAPGAEAFLISPGAKDAERLYLSEEEEEAAGD